LPDGIFSYQKSQFGYILKGLAVENFEFRNILSAVGIFCDRLEYFGVFWYIFSQLSDAAPRKIWQP
jgi:hypothetical protein